MSKIRFNALKEVLNRKPLKIKEVGKRSELFGVRMFLMNMPCDSI